MLRQIPLRQRARKALVILAFLSFPITMNYLSPYVIIDGAMNGIVNGSLVMFGLMFVSSPCILCGTCVDNCAKNPIRYSFSAGK
jgi:ferredoxin